jgi:hypothetical protein
MSKFCKESRFQYWHHSVYTTLLITPYSLLNHFNKENKMIRISRKTFIALVFVLVGLLSSSILYAQEHERRDGVQPFVVSAEDPLREDRSQGGMDSRQSGNSAIAYMRPNNDTGDEIWLIEPNGSNNRRIWSAGQKPSAGIEELRSLVWRPDAGELAFIGNHERFHCSIYDADIYSIFVDGSGYRRVTNAPACSEFENYPKGIVQIEVENRGTHTARFSVYFQGATEFQGIYVGAGQVETVTLTNVADFGPDILQYAIAINNVNVSRRSWGAPVDVKAGATVKARMTVTDDDAIMQFGARSPTWRSDGSRLGYIVGLGTVNQINRDPLPPALGEDLLPGGAATTRVLRLAWSPVASMANHLLYIGEQEENGSWITSVYRIQEGSQGQGERLVAAEPWDLMLDVAWLPDGSGFLYAMTENYDDNADIYEYNFASRKSTRLTGLNGEFARRISISPDGQQVVFERATALWYGGWEEPMVDLWIMNRDGSNLRLLVKNGYAPAWSPGPIQNPPSATPTATPTPTPTQTPTPTPLPGGTPGTERYIFLPFMQR